MFRDAAAHRIPFKLLEASIDITLTTDDICHVLGLKSQTSRDRRSSITHKKYRDHWRSLIQSLESPEDSYKTPRENSDPSEHAFVTTQRLSAGSRRGSAAVPLHARRASITMKRQASRTGSFRSRGSNNSSASDASSVAGYRKVSWVI